ncbi:MAG: hypothetical protein LBV17_05015 [Treponema sp.]|nr:hypothetical protein [Treponema sp.]
MKKILFYSIFIPYIIFSQENINLNLFSGFTYFEESSYSTTSEKIKSSVLPFIALLSTVGLNVGIREGIYRNNYQDNWWGTVNGALTLGLAGEIIGYGIAYGIYKTSNESFNEIYTLWGPILGFATGITMSFFSPFKEAFRENTFLYYSFPTLFAIGLTYVIIDIWIGKEDKPRKLQSNALLNFNYNNK